jgi:hypothetical protein
MGSPAPRSRPSLRAVFANWSTFDAPFCTKVRMVATNNLTKLRKRQDCCGNHGQPGC